jgi:hypothetical protein
MSMYEIIIPERIYYSLHQLQSSFFVSSHNCDADKMDIG